MGVECVFPGPPSQMSLYTVGQRVKQFLPREINTCLLLLHNFPFVHIFVPKKEVGGKNCLLSPKSFQTEMNTIVQQFFPREINTFLLLLRTFPLVPHTIFHIGASVFCDVCTYFYQLSNNISALFDLIPFDSTRQKSR